MSLGRFQVRHRLTRYEDAADRRYRRPPAASILSIYLLVRVRTLRSIHRSIYKRTPEDRHLSKKISRYAHLPNGHVIVIDDRRLHSTSVPAPPSLRSASSSCKAALPRRLGVPLTRRRPTASPGADHILPSTGKLVSAIYVGCV